MGLTSVTNNSSSCLLGISTPTNASRAWFTRPRYRVPLKGCSTPRFQISSKTEVHLGILLGLYTTWEPKGDVRYSKNFREDGNQHFTRQEDLPLFLTFSQSI